MTAPVSLIRIRTDAHKALLHSAMRWDSCTLNSWNSYMLNGRTLYKGAQVQKKYTREWKFFLEANLFIQGRPCR